MTRRNLSGARILITGASSGIGRALALRLAMGGSRLLVTGRRAERLADLALQLCSGGCEVEWLAGDIADNSVRQQLIDRVAQRWGALEVLVNNAGIGAHGLWSQAAAETMRQVMEVNFFAPVELTRAALPWLLRGNAPLVVNIGSVLGHYAIPRRAEYCSSKFALRAFSDAVRIELTAQDIDVLHVSPSTTTSEFFDRAISLPNEPPRHRRGAAPERVARAIERAMRAGRRELVLSWGGKFMVLLSRLSPALLHALLVRYARSQEQR